MAFHTPHSDTKEVFEKIIDSSELSRLIDITILSDNNQKVVAKATKASNILKHLAAVDVVIIVNEDVFEELPELQQTMIADEVLAGVGYNYNTEKPVISKGDVQTHHLFLKKYTYERYEVLQESIKTTYEVIKQRKEEGGAPIVAEETAEATTPETATV